MKEASDRQVLQLRLRELLAAHQEIGFAYLFGSFEEDLPYHDVDVAVSLEPPLPVSHVLDYEMALSVELTLALHAGIDVHVLDGAPLGFQFQVLRGRPLLVRDEERLSDFVERVGWDYMSYAHLSSAYLREVLS